MASELKNLSQAVGEVPSGKGKRIAIIVAEWNNEVTFKLRDGAIEELLKNEVEESGIEIYYVPGCYELPLAAQSVVERTNVDAAICLGCVVRGDTPHFDYVCQAATHGILQAGLATKTPILFGVLTVDKQQHALDRAGGIHGNKGNEAAFSALKMLQYKY